MKWIRKTNFTIRGNFGTTGSWIEIQNWRKRKNFTRIGFIAKGIRKIKIRHSKST